MDLLVAMDTDHLRHIITKSNSMGMAALLANRTDTAPVHRQTTQELQVDQSERPEPEESSTTTNSVSSDADEGDYTQSSEGDEGDEGDTSTADADEVFESLLLSVREADRSDPDVRAGLRLIAQASTSG